MRFHLHKWEKLFDLKLLYTGESYRVARVYRHCVYCNKWQREEVLWTDSIWHDSYTPIGVENLIPEKEAKKIIKDRLMKQQSLPDRGKYYD